MSNRPTLPTYRDLFGALDFQPGEPGRSALSPAAYLADLLQLIEDRFETTDLFVRRPDIRALNLDADNSFTLLPYLSIVNEVLEARVVRLSEQPDAQAVLASAEHPLPLPFDRDHARLRELLALLRAAPGELYRLLTPTPQADTLARESLGLSEAQVAILVEDRSADPAKLARAYGLADAAGLQGLAQLDAFQAATDIDASSLRELLHLGLSETALDAQGNTERSAAGELFVNAGEASGYAELDAAQTRLQWGGGVEPGPLPASWLDRAHRLLRLSMWTGLSLRELDRVLRTVCDSRLDRAALRRLAVVRELAGRWQIDLATVCSLLGELDDLGDDAPLVLDETTVVATADSPFDRVFNGAAAELAEAYFLGAHPYVPEPYAEFVPVEVQGDLLLEGNKAARVRIQGALGLSSTELESLVEALRERAATRGRASRLSGAFGPLTLSLLHRAARIAELLDLGVLELLELLDVIAADPSLRGLGALGLVEDDHAALADDDLYRVLESGSVAERTYLLRTVVAVWTWAQAAGLGVSDLVDICLPPPVAEDLEALEADRNPDPRVVAATQARLALCQGLLEAYAPTALNATAFTGEELGARAARRAHRALLEGDYDLLAEADPGLVLFDEDAAREWAFDSVAGLDQVEAAELAELDLGEALAELLHVSLLRNGTLDLEGAVLPEAFEELGAFVVEAPLDRHGPAVFDALARLAKAAAKPGESPEAIEIELYLSDLLALNIPKAEAEAILANMRLRGEIDEQGRVAQASKYLDESGRYRCKLALGLGAETETVRAFFEARRERFLAAPVTVSAGDFQALGMEPAELDGLIRNLIFNGVLDGRRRVVDKQAVLAMAPGELRLALPYHRHRRAVQAVLQARVATARARELKVSAEDLRPLAADILARRVIATLQARGELDSERRPSPAFRELLRASRTPTLELGAEYSVAERLAIGGHLHGQVVERDRFELTDAMAAGIELDAAGAKALRELLVDTGDLLPSGGLPPERLATFLDINGALNFELEGSEDYARDVFFLLHDLALRLDARVRALVTSLEGVAKAQRLAVLRALASGIELSECETQVLVEHMLVGDGKLAATLLVPVLDAREDDGSLSEIPEHRRLRRFLDRAVQFAAFARKVQLGHRGVALAFAEQGLVDKFPESIELPAGASTIDALLPDLDGELIVFHGARLWSYDVDSLTPLATAEPLTLISPLLEGVEAIDAAYTDAEGDHWIYAAGRVFTREHDDTRWVEVERELGKVESKFVAPTEVDAAFVDHEGFRYLFIDDQYLRSADGVHVDPGYPRTLATHWSEELDFTMPAALRECGEGGLVDAAFTDASRRTWLFRGAQVYRSDAPNQAMDLRDRWGRVEADFAELRRLDAVAEVDGLCALIHDEHVLVHGDSLETVDARALEGYPTTLERWLPELPQVLREGLDAGFTDWTGQVHLFGEDHYGTRNDGVWSVGELASRWGRVRNELQDTGRVDAALMGLDGRLYVFSGTQYLRYSDLESGYADEGYPRTIATDWGGLERVDAAFVLDGRTYLFGTMVEQGAVYLRFGTRDYEVADEGYPRATDDNWWNLPFALTEAGFATPDGIMNGGDGRVYLFSGDQLIHFDHNQRVWSDPEPIREHFAGLPFDSISAGVTDGDGHTWLFSAGEAILDHDGVGEVIEASGPMVARYSDADFTRLDDRFPKPTRHGWGRIRNALQDGGHVDAAVRLITPVIEEHDEDEDELRSKLLTAAVEPVLAEVVYLFSGEQFYRYSSPGLEWVDEGYPKRLDALRDEPRFAKLDDAALAAMATSLDGVWADGGEVFVFTGAHVHVASTDWYREIDGLVGGGLRAAAHDEGRLIAYASEGWRHLRMPEGPAATRPAALPRFLRGAPEAFRQPEAVLLGHDDNAYLFANGRCWDRALERDYPIAQAWGRTGNAIAEDERVDAGLRSPEGRLFVFRGGEYLQFSPDALKPGAGTSWTLPSVADGPAGSIAERFGGLRNVHLAYTHGEHTYLLEAPNAEGEFRYQRYCDEALEEPEFDEPMAADLSFWKLPSIHVEQGFDRVDAVLVEGEDLFLIRGREFLHFEASTQTWTYPRELELFWPGLPERHPDFEAVSAAFEDGEGTTWFFAEGTCFAYRRDASDPKLPGSFHDIEARWGQIDNRLRQREAVDATLVVGAYTYLFSGDQYVRYTGSNYERVDAGYPKRLVANLREEPGFAHLPEELERHFEAVEEAIAAGSEGLPRSVDAAWATRGVITLIAGGRAYACVDALTRTLTLGQLGVIRNELQRRGRVDASFVDQGGALWLFSGDQAYRYTEHDAETVDAGFPRSIPEQLVPTLIGTPRALPEAFHVELDGAMLEADGAVLLLAEGEFLRMWPMQPERPTQRGSLAQLWQTPANPFAATEQDPNPRIDAALLGPEGELYVFKGEHYVRYTEPSAETVDEGYPRAIRDDWGDLPVDFEAGIDGAFSFEGRRYMSRGEAYVRYSGEQLRRIDAIGAQPFARRWRHANDFLIRDLHLIWRAVDIDRREGVAEALSPEEGPGGSIEGSFLDLLIEPQPDVTYPYALLAALFEWPIDDLQWLVRRGAFLHRPGRTEALEAEFDLELLLRVVDIMELCQRLGSYPSELHGQVWQPLYGPVDSRAPAAAADTLRRLLGTLYPGADWLTIGRQLLDADNRARRDALVAWILAREPALAEPRDLYEELLVDIQVDPSLDTSRIKEAIAATQLYMHRYLVNLEAPTPRAGAEQSPVAAAAEAKAQLKRQWEWMQNFRVWEANRKVFLHPENYIRPELRDTRTPSFMTLQDDLLQGEINDQRSTEVFKKYLDEYTEVSSLTIAGGYIREGRDDASDRELVLFGQTGTDPKRYYYRTATFLRGRTQDATWAAWQPLDVEIDSPRVYPVDAFGRLFVFWAQIELEAGEGSSTSIRANDVNGGSQASATVNTRRRLQVYFSYYDLNLRWIPAQKLGLSVVEGRSIDGVQLVVERSLHLGAEEQENIIVGLSYSAGGQVVRRNASLTSALETRPATRPPSDSAGIELFSSLFAASERPDQVVRLNSAADSSEGPWYSFHLKGGSFLCKPAVASLDDRAMALQPLAGNLHGLPQWDGVDAGLESTDGSTYLFHNAAGAYAKIGADGSMTEEPVHRRWGHIDNSIARGGQFDASWWQDGKMYMSLGGEYLRYSKGTLLADEVGVLTLAGNTDGLPEWSKIESAFTDAQGRVWYFGQGLSVRSDDLTTTTPIGERWGRGANDFTTATGRANAVRTGFTVGDKTFVVGPKVYLRYTGSSYEASDAGYPKAQNLFAILAELGCTNNDEAYKDMKIDVVLTEAKRTVIHTDNGRNFQLDGTEVIEFAASSGRGRGRGRGRGQDEEARTELTHARSVVVHDKREFVFGRKDSRSLQQGDSLISLSRVLSAAMLGLDGKLYLFAGSEFITVPSQGLSLDSISKAVDAWRDTARNIGAFWGTQASAIVRNQRVDAALRRGEHTFLVCDGEYVRYTGEAYELCDEGYPKPLAGNPDGLPEWTGLSAALDNADGKGNACYFDGQEHAFATDLTKRESNAFRWGLIHNQMLARGVDAAWVEGQAHMFVCSQQLIRYTADEAGQLGRFMDVGYPKQLELARFGVVRAAFVIGEDFYVVGDGVFVCCPVSEPERILPGYPKKGHLGALAHDVNMRHGTGRALRPTGFEHLGVRGATVSGNTIVFDIDEGNNYRGVTLKARLNLGHGELHVEWIHHPWHRIWGWSWGGWHFDPALPDVQEENTEVDVTVGGHRYVFRDNQFMRLTAGEGMTSWQPDARSVDQVWGAAAIDAAVRLRGKLYLFIGDHYLQAPGGDAIGDLSLVRAIDGAWGNLPASLHDGVDAALYAGGVLTLFRGDHYLRFTDADTEPYEVSTVRYDVVRLTTATASTLNQRLFAGGLDGLLALRSQEVDELPRFAPDHSSSETIRFNPARIGSHPIGTHLDFSSANGIYYWEIFFHAPFLVAQSLNTSQRFDEARRWYEYIFDPTEAPDTWKFLPFLAADVEAIAERIEGRLSDLGSASVDTTSVAARLRAIAATLLPMDMAFQGERALSPEEEASLLALAKLDDLRRDVLALDARRPEAVEARRELEETVGVIEQLAMTWTAMQNAAGQLRVFLDDPFDPHALASLRRIAYRKALLMRYIDNLLDWGDMLFSQYTRESINEARMLYVLAWDLLGRRPAPLGRRVLSEDRPYAALRDASEGYDFLLYLQSGLDPATTDLSFAGKAPQSIAWPSYFYLPENQELIGYWGRVEDRLHKIRHGLNLMGVKQPLPLFQPPIDPMAIVSAVAGGASVAGAVASVGPVSVPHYRFRFLMDRAQGLVSKLQQFGGELLATLEKRDAEKLSRLQVRQESELHTMTVEVRRLQIAEAEANKRGLQQGLLNAQRRGEVYQDWLDKGLNPLEIAQLSLMAGSVAAHAVSAIFRIIAAFGGAAPDGYAGPFNLGIKGGGDQIGRSQNALAEILQGVAEGLSIGGEILGIVGQHERMKDEWRLQKDLAAYDANQISEQLVGADAAIASANQELAIVERQIAHNRAVDEFYRGKFSKQELYQWMADRLSTLYYQTYQLALDYARAAERAYQFETGAPVQDVQFVRGHHWDSQRKGLTAGDALGLDLDRMEAAYTHGDARRLEIGKQVSLLELDPLAFLKLQAEGACEFELSEALFDYDFPGHYRRQIKTIALVLDAGEGVTVNATLTQLTNRTVLHPDAKAVNFLLNARGEAPVSLRSNWKSQQQIALSHHDKFDKNNGLFELRFDSERYLPFEGTGAVSRWRLELGGKVGSYDRSAIKDVTIDLRYSALQGGEAFAAQVRGLLKPYDALRHFDVAAAFPEAWQRFRNGLADTLVLPLSPAHFPNMASSRIRSVLAHYVLDASGTGGVTASLELGESIALPESRMVDTAGLRVGQSGAAVTLRVRGDRGRLSNLVLVMSYRAAVR